ncbi:MAG: hypothetical protein KDA28_09555 [Phycisphaerales bacterium]|nr:hypothetical protein [Phycisphaerales bacterium]
MWMMTPPPVSFVEYEVTRVGIVLRGVDAAEITVNPRPLPPATAPGGPWDREPAPQRATILVGRFGESGDWPVWTDAADEAGMFDSGEPVTPFEWPPARFSHWRMVVIAAHWPLPEPTVAVSFPAQGASLTITPILLEAPMDLDSFTVRGPGDVNADGRYDVRDLRAFTNAMYDWNVDGRVDPMDVADLAAWLQDPPMPWRDVDEWYFSGKRQRR